LQPVDILDSIKLVKFDATVVSSKSRIVAWKIP